MQRASNVRRRNHNRVRPRIRILVDFRSEIATLFPARVVMPLGFFRVVSFGDFDHLCKRLGAVLGIAVISARRSLLTDSGVGKTLAISSSTITTKGCSVAIFKNRLGRDLL